MEYYGDSRLTPHLVFRRGSFMKCVFCGNVADTREHTPSKVLLHVPYPSNLTMVPSCKTCNNSFSDDELYADVLLELLKANYDLSYKINDEIRNRLNTKGGIEAQKAAEIVISNNYALNDSRIERVLCKLAICHAVYDLSEGYSCDDWSGHPTELIYKLRPQLTTDERNLMDIPEPLEGKLLPEVGSRGYEHIQVIQLKLAPIGSGSPTTLSFPCIMWNDVQENQYRYMSFLEGTDLRIKIVIGEFLYATILFRRDDTTSIKTYL